jgi:predicted dehydrogenase
MVLEAAELAEKKGLAFVGGTQRRHQASYIDVVKRLHDGAIGKLVAGHGYWMQGGLWMKPRKPEWSDMEWQVRNWAYFTWLSGDTLVEQAIHQVDVMNWVMGGPPRLAVGMGGRQVRTDPAYGHIYDHFAIDYEYPSGARVTLMSRQTDNAYNRIGESAIGTRGTAFPSGRIKPFEGEEYRYEGEGNNPLVQEHADLIASVRAGKPLNVGKRFAESILTGIMGRMSAYTGQPVTWDFALKSKLDLTPRKLEFGDAPMPPVAMPGVDKLI